VRGRKDAAVLAVQDVDTTGLGGPGRPGFGALFTGHSHPRRMSGIIFADMA